MPLSSPITSINPLVGRTQTDRERRGTEQTINMSEELNIPLRRYQCRLSCYQWLAAITLLLNPPFGGISFFLCRKSRQSLMAGKIEESSRQSQLSTALSVCGLLCTLIVVTLFVLWSARPATPKFESNSSFSTLIPPLKNYENFKENFSNPPSNNETELAELFDIFHF